MSRSASSRTNQRHLPILNDDVFCRWSRRRPGVETRIGTPLRSRAFSCDLFSPPVSSPDTNQRVRRGAEESSADSS